jgi:hypothetical protein
MRDDNLITDDSELSEEQVLKWIEAKSEQLHSQSRLLVDDYWRQLKKFNAKEPGRIGLRIRRREHNFSFSIEWYRMATIRQNGELKPICQYLKKGLGYRYPLQRFLQNEPAWEVTLVEELETEFANIRRQMALLGKMRDAFQQFRKAGQRQYE